MSISVSDKNAKRGASLKSGAKGDASVMKIPPRDRIVSSACQLFREHGIRGIGVDAIAEAADTNKMTLYRHFGSKDDLVCEALRHSSTKAAELWETLEQRYPGDPLGQLNGWVQALARCLAEEPFGCDAANAAVELKEQNHPAHAVIETFKNQQQRRLVDLCRAAGVEDAELLADTLFLLLEGARVSRLATGSDGPSMRFTRACQATLASFGVVVSVE